MNDTHYIEQLQSIIRHLHQCESTHLGSNFVQEIIGGKTAWQQTVERFAVTGHPRAKYCFAWADRSAADGQQYFAVLELPPIRNASDAVKYSMLANESRLMKGSTMPPPTPG